MMCFVCQNFYLLDVPAAADSQISRGGGDFCPAESSCTAALLLKPVSGVLAARSLTLTLRFCDFGIVCF